MSNVKCKKKKKKNYTRKRFWQLFTSAWVKIGTKSKMIRVFQGSSAPVPVVSRSDPLRPARLYKAEARDVLPAL